MSKVMINAERLMELAWENPLLDEKDCAMLMHMIKQVQEEEKRRKSS